MDKLECCIAKDLLPLYIDDVLSADSAELLRDHLESCESCRQEYRTMLKDVILPTNQQVQEENSRVLKSFKSKWTAKKIFISVISSLLAVFLYLAFTREYMPNSDFFHPKNVARAGTVGSLCLGELSTDGEWTQLRFERKKPFRYDLWDVQLPYLNFNSIFYEKQVVNSAYSSGPAEIRILDKEENVILGPFTVDAGYAVSLQSLQLWTEYIVEYRAEGDFYIFNFI